MRYRYIEIVRSLWGAALLATPRVILSRVHGVEVDRKAVVVARILGARHLVQAALSGVNPSPEVIAGGVWVDAVHSVTAFGLAAVDPDRAIAVIADGTVAAAWALFGLRDLKFGPVPPPEHDRRRDLLARVILPVLPGGNCLLARANETRNMAAPR
jgi:hypothetical protein